MIIAQTAPVRLADGLSRDYLLYRRLAPRAIAEDGTVLVAAAPDALLDDLDDIAFVYQAPVRVETAPWEEVERAIELLTTARDREIDLAQSDHDASHDVDADTRELANQAPVVRFVNLLVREAHDAGASDIHLESARTGLAVRFRLDGALVPAPEPPPGLQHGVVSRIKLLAEIDIAERRRPQDGRIRVRLDQRDLDLRVSTVPTMHGESVVLRLLERGGRPVALEELGMSSQCLAGLRHALTRPHGMILVTGPTGSGKTTTLYASLLERDTAAEKIITVEDPIEYQLPGVTQMPLSRQAGMSFATALRSILRQDPDVLMIGEMRDQETAEIAIQAAMTGHLVFSTLHTNDAVSAIPRLIDLGVPRYLIAATLEATLGQRLVRRICDGCRAPYEPRPDAVAAMGGLGVGRQVERGRGCPACRGTGFRGRVGIFEFVLLDDDLRDAIAADTERARLRDLCRAAGWQPLRDAGRQLVERGVTTIEEVLRVSEC